MRRLTSTMAAVVLLTAGCGGGGGDPGGNASPPPTAVRTSPAAGETVVPGPEGNIPVKNVSPKPPGTAGESTTIQMKIEAGGADQYGAQAQRFPEPSVLLARSPEEAAAIAKALPPGALKVMQGWQQYGGRALVAIIGGAQPDPNYRLHAEAISVTKGGNRLTAFGQITRKEGGAAQVITVPWAVASVELAVVILAKRCVLAFQGASARPGDCHGG